METRQELTEAVWARVDSLRIPVNKADYPDGPLSSLNLYELSAETGQSLRWLLTGERDLYEPKIAFCTNSYPFDE